MRSVGSCQARRGFVYKDNIAGKVWQEEVAFVLGEYREGVCCMQRKMIRVGVKKGRSKRKNW